MSRWKDIYQSKLVSAAEAVKCIKSHDRVVVGFACGEPQVLVEAMVHRAGELEDVEVDHMIAVGPSKYCLPENERSFRHRSLFIGPGSRKAVNEGRADYVPIFFYQVPRLFRDGFYPVDVCLMQVSPPNKNGYCSMGVSADYSIAAMEAAKILIAEVNPRMPKTYGPRMFHVSEFDHLVEVDYPILAFPRAKVGDKEKKIAEYVASLVDDGATLQMGIGSVPEGVASLLTGKENLAVHSEMLADWCVDLIEAGALTGSLKTMHRHKIVSTFAMGTQELYDAMDDNPTFEMWPVDYVNDSTIIAQQHKMISINSALQVDLQGQICADSIGPQLYSGVGGQVDFIRGAANCPGGKSIIALNATAKQGTISKIVPLLDLGSSVTASRNEVHYVVTEFGIADLRYKTVRERGEALIEIAHPDFRADLRKTLYAQYPGYARYRERIASAQVSD
ncbi:MAG: 4-hydroxybutyrate CoA-transferase [Gracilibacteraceae bacterium]|nr:4-hydroxybutyrate CoA-transferase [Gracilibacteraceae bacterium]